MKLNVIFNHDSEGTKIHSVWVAIAAARKRHPVIGSAKIFNAAIATPARLHDGLNGRMRSFLDD